MDEKILRGMFLDNDGVIQAVYAFCQDYPGWLEARAAVRQLDRELERAMGSKWYLRFEEELNLLWALENRAFYLFGVNLRRELLESLTGKG